MDQDNRFTLQFYDTRYSYDVEAKLRTTILPVTEKPKEIAVDFILLGFGIWTMKYPDKQDPYRNRLEAYKEGLAKLMKVCHINAAGK